MRTRVRPWIAWGTGLKQQSWERRCTQNQEHTPWVLFILGGFYLHPPCFFLKIWTVLQDFAKGLRHYHGVSTLNKKYPSAPLSPTQNSHFPSQGQDFTLKSFAEVSFSFFMYFPSLSSQGSVCCGCWKGEQAAINIPHTPVKHTHPDVQ